MNFILIVLMLTVVAGLAILFAKLREVAGRVVQQQKFVRMTHSEVRRGLPMTCPECQSRWCPGEDVTHEEIATWTPHTCEVEQTLPVGAAAVDTPATAAVHHADWD